MDAWICDDATTCEFCLLSVRACPIVLAVVVLVVVVVSSFAYFNLTLASSISIAAAARSIVSLCVAVGQSGSQIRSGEFCWLLACLGLVVIVRYPAERGFELQIQSQVRE